MYGIVKNRFRLVQLSLLPKLGGLNCHRLSHFLNTFSVRRSLGLSIQLRASNVS